MENLTVKLSSCGNPDFKQDEPLSPAKRIKVQTLREAIEQCKAYIAEWNLGGGNWDGGQVYDGSGQIAQISYNGRIWGLDNNEIRIN
jgi:hypothetical protein